MKEITSYASNCCAVVNGSKIEPQAEIALVLSEIDYRYTSNGNTAKERICETVRFCAPPHGIRKLAELLTKTADETDAEFKAAMLAQMQSIASEVTKEGAK